MSMLRITDSATASDLGRVRKANEDAYYVRAPLFVVADGMGGAQAGEVASRIAADAFAGGLDESLSPEGRMAAVVLRANREIHEKSVADPELHGMGTTLTAALLGDAELTIAHVGDSRAYRYRDGELTRLTRDHSVVGEMVRRGAITEREAESHPQRSILTRALGPEPEVEVDTLSHAVRGGDVYLLCSDGLTGMVDEAGIAEVLARAGSMREAADELVRRANQNGGVDNITVVAFAVSGGAKGAQPGASTEPAADEPDAALTVAGAPAIAPPGEAERTDAQAPPGARPQTAAAAQANGQVSPPAHSAPGPRARRDETRRKRLIVGGVITALVVALAIGGAVVGSLNVYFLGANDQGLVTVYRGLPYDLPLSLSMYTRDYVTTVPAAQLTAAQRAEILDHKLRTRSDALDLARKLEHGEIKAGGSAAATAATGDATSP